MRSLFLAMANLRTHTTLFPTYFTATFSGPFRSHLSNLLQCVELFVRQRVGRAGKYLVTEILIDGVNHNQPKNIRIGSDGWI